MREHTPSGLKWVANEVAAISGDLERIQKEMAALSAKGKRLEQQRAALSQVGAAMGVPELHCIMPAVRVHNSYGKRGFLVDWLRGVLQAAAPRALDTQTLAVLAEENFQLTFLTPAARAAYRNNSLGRALRKLLQLGLAERLHNGQQANGPGVWRWRTQLPSLVGLEKNAEEQEEVD